MRFYLSLLIILLFVSCATTEQQNNPQPTQNISTNNEQKIILLENKINELEQKIKELEQKKKQKKDLSSEEKDILIKKLSKLTEEQQKNIEYLKKITKDISLIKNQKQPVVKKIEKKIVVKQKNPQKKPEFIKPKKIVKRNFNKTNENNLYISCYKLYIKKQFEKSEKCFNNFIAKYPKSNLISNAYFWIGETFFARGNYPKAIDYYDIILTKFSSSRKVPAALLKEGLAFYKLNDNEGAKIFLEKVVHDYPKTKQAEYAKKYLEKYNLK